MTRSGLFARGLPERPRQFLAAQKVRNSFGFTGAKIEKKARQSRKLPSYHVLPEIAPSPPAGARGVDSPARGA
jgi:hypothetical protein